MSTSLYRPAGKEQERNGAPVGGVPVTGPRLSRRLRAVLQERYGAAADTLRRLLPEPPRCMVVTGSGMSGLLDGEAETVTGYGGLPGFPTPTVAGHGGVVRRATVEDVPLLIFAGRSHLYEGVSMQDVVAPVAVAALLGVEAVMLLNSAGGLHPDVRTGDILLLTDTVNMTFRQARRGWCYATPPAYLHQPALPDEQWRRRTAAVLTGRRHSFREGVYIGVTGPNYETPAEVRFYRRLGDAIGMSTVHEAEFAQFCGMKVAGCSLISNTLHEVCPPVVSHDEVLEAARTGLRAVEAWICAACGAFADAEHSGQESATD